MANTKLISDNRKARHDYFLEETFEAGISLKGTEIKSIRKGQVNLRDSYVDIKDGQAFVKGMHIAQYDHGNIFNHEEKRDRRLLLHKKEIRKMAQKIKLQGYTIVPTKMYLSHGLVKLEIALAKGKNVRDKRQDVKIRDVDREIRKAEKYSY